MVCKTNRLRRKYICESFVNVVAKRDRLECQNPNYTHLFGKVFHSFLHAPCKIVQLRTPHSFLNLSTKRVQKCEKQTSKNEATNHASYLENFDLTDDVQASEHFEQIRLFSATTLPLADPHFSTLPQQLQYRTRLPTFCKRFVTTSNVSKFRVRIQNFKCE